MRRAKEVGYIRDKRVYNKIFRSQSGRSGWKVVQRRWIDINKGDDENPNYRSTLGGKEFNNEPMEGLFAGTWPLEALRYLIHEAATVRPGKRWGRR